MISLAERFPPGEYQRLTQLSIPPIVSDASEMSSISNSPVDCPSRSSAPSSVSKRWRCSRICRASPGSRFFSSRS